MHSHQIIAADCLTWMQAQPAGTTIADVTFTSPPYENNRTYSMGFSLKSQAWVDWMIPRVVEACRLTRGLVFINATGPVRKFKYSPVIEWLVADLTRHHGIVCGPSPYVFHRVGIPGSGAKHYHRRDWEPIYGFALPCNLPLRWADNTATGHPPKWAPGGEMSNRSKDGSRINSNIAKRNQWGHSGSGKRAERRRDGSIGNAVRPSHIFADKLHTKTMPDGTKQTQGYVVHPRANSGNVIHTKENQLQFLNIIDILECYEQYTKEDPAEILRVMRTAIDSKEIPEWVSGIYSRVCKTPILQSLVSRQGIQSSEWAEAWRTSTSREEDSKANEEAGHLREVRQQGKAGGPSSRWGRDEQLDGEPGSPMHVVPQKGTQNRDLLDSWVRKEILRTGILLNALPEIQKIWKSICEASQSVLSSSNSGDIIKCTVGGGKMGSDYASSNEAPFPEALASFFVRSFCPPSGTIFDPFAGSGTIAAVAKKHSRNSISIDIRQSQCDIITQRLAEIPDLLF